MLADKELNVLIIKNFAEKEKYIIKNFKATLTWVRKKNLGGH